jgi:hypothetical protein
MQQFPLPFSARDFKKIQVIRVIDAYKIKLQRRSGWVSLAAASRTAQSTNSKLLLPAKSSVLVTMMSYRPAKLSLCAMV